MDERHTAPLTDGALAREVEALVAVEPSPEFRARVRGRIETERAAPRRGPAWPLTVAGGAVAATALGVLGLLGLQGPVVPQPGRPGVTVAESAPASQPVTGGLAGVHVAERAELREASAERRSATPTVRPVESPGDTFRVSPIPEVVIPEAERRGLDLLLAELREAGSTAVLGEAVAEAESVLGPPWLTIDPIVLAPMRGFVASEGEGL